jgi:hypothetical protein
MRPYILLPVAALALLVLGCSNTLNRTLAPKGVNPGVTGYYSIDTAQSHATLPKTKFDCRKYVKAPGGGQDDVVAAVCYLDIDRLSEAEARAAKIKDTCYAGVFAYDLAVVKGLPKTGRFERLQTLLDCSQEPDFQNMIKARSKLAHYE